MVSLLRRNGDALDEYYCGEHNYFTTRSTGSESEEAVNQINDQLTETSRRMAKGEVCWKLS